MLGKRFVDLTDDQDNEEQELIENCRHGHYAKVTKFLRVLTRISFLKLDHSRYYDLSRSNSFHLPNMLRVDSAFDPISPGASFLRKTNVWFSRIFTTYVSYIIIKLTLFLVLELEYDRHLNAIQPAVRPGSNHSDKCALKEDIVLVSGTEDSNHYTRMANTRYWLATLGYPLLTTHGIGQMEGMLLAMVSFLFFFHARCIVRRDSLRMDHLSFISDPISERRRVKVALQLVVRTITISMQNYRQNLISVDHLGIQNCAAVSLIENNENKVESIYMMETLLGARLFESIRPAYLAPKWHAIKLQLNYLCPIGVGILNSIGAFFIFTYLIYINLALRTANRLKVVGCSRWHRDGAFIDDKEFLEPLKSEDRDTYLAHDGSLLSSLHLALLVESKYFFTASMLITCAELLPMCVVAPFWTAMYMSIFVSSVMDQFVWLIQLDIQVDRCLSILRHIRITKDSDSAEANRNLIESMVKAYLNFELFRRQENNFSKVSKVFSIPALTLLVLLSGTCFVAGSINNRLEFWRIIWLIIYLALHMNIFLLLLAYRAYRIERLMKKLAQMLTEAETSTINLPQCTDLWRRQRLGIGETRRLYGPGILGGALSYEHLLTFNGYFISLLVLMLRVNSGQRVSSPMDDRLSIRLQP